MLVIFASMKTNGLLLLVIFSLFSFCACEDNSHPRILVVADSLANANPDSAVVLLRSLKNDFATASEETRMYYHLLCIKANDKAYIPHTTDSLILPVLHYYMDKNDRYLPEAYYYAARVYRDLGDAPQALDYLEKAMTCANIDMDADLKSNIYSQMRTLFLYQELYDEALKVSTESYKYDASREDNEGMVYDLRDMADAYRGSDRLDSALYYYQKSYDLACSMQDSFLIEMLQGQIASIYIQLKMYDEAKNVLKISYKTTNKTALSSLYSIASKLYRQTGYNDSAVYCYKKLLDIGTIYAKRHACWGLAGISLEKANSIDACRFLKQYMQYDDSIYKITNAETIRKMHSLYNYQLREKENARLKIESNRKTQFIIYFLLLGVVLGIIYQQYNRRKRLLLIIRLNKSERLKEEQYRKSSLFIEENRKKIIELERKLQDADYTNSELKERLLKEQEMVFYAQKRAEIDADEQREKWVKLFKSDIYCYIQQQIKSENYKMDDTKWELLEKTVNEIYESFTEKLNSVYKLSHYELQVSLLIKANIQPVDIAKLTNHTKPSVSLVRRRLYEKFFNKKGEPKMWDEFIVSL